VEERLNRVKQQLQQSSYKLTPQREATVRVLIENEKDHLSAEDVYLKVKDKAPEIGLATVYRTLNLLEDSGMVTSISFGTQGKKFELATKPHHDHLICKNCGKIVEFEDPSVEKKQEEIAKKNGFTLTGHLMQLYGTCKNCSKKES